MISEYMEKHSQQPKVILRSKNIYWQLDIYIDNLLDILMF